MPTLLHLDSSANRSGESVSRRLTLRYAQTWRTANGEAGYHHRDLAAQPPPALDTAFCTLGRRLERRGLVAPGQVAAHAETAAERAAWAQTHPLIAEAHAADTLLIGAPMYNYAIPAPLKAWIDRISFPLPGDLLAGTTVIVVATRGGRFGTPDDHHIPYLRTVLRKHGATDIRFVTAEFTLAGYLPHLNHRRPEAQTSLAAAQAALDRG